MNFNNYTIKAQEGIQKAQEIATSNQQQFIEPAHILKGLFIVDEYVIPYLLQKLNVNVGQLNLVIDSIIKSYP